MEGLASIQSLHASAKPEAWHAWHEYLRPDAFEFEAFVARFPDPKEQLSMWTTSLGAQIFRPEIRGLPFNSLNSSLISTPSDADTISHLTLPFVSLPRARSE